MTTEALRSENHHSIQRYRQNPRPSVLGAPHVRRMPPTGNNVGQTVLTDIFKPVNGTS